MKLNFICILYILYYRSPQIFQSAVTTKVSKMSQAIVLTEVRHLMTGLPDSLCITAGIVVMTTESISNIKELRN